MEATLSSGARGDRANLLVVDDLPANVLALRAALEPLDENIVEASSGEAALEYLLKNDCAAILLDVRLPGMSGFEVADALRSRPRTRDIPILFVTGTLQDGASAGYAHGAFDYILKPFNPDVMRAKVSAIVKLYRLRRNIEEQRDVLAASEQRARAETASERASMYDLLAQSPALIARLRGPEQVFDYANSRYREAIGNRTLVGKRLRDALPELEGQPFAKLLDSVYRSGEPFVADEVPAQLARGAGGTLETAYFNFSYLPTRDHSGSVDGVLVYAVDVSDQMRVRLELEEISRNLRASEARFHGMAEAIPQQVWTARADGTVDFVNSKFAEYAGKSTDQILAEGWVQQIQPDDFAAFSAAWEHSLSTGEPLEHELQLLRKNDGAFRWHLVRALPELDEAGHVLHWYGTLTDIQEQNAVAEQLAYTNVFQQQLLAVVGHDLRNPLNAISMTAQLLQNKADPTLEPLVARISRSVARMKRIIGDIINFTRARIGSGLPVVRQPCSARQLCREVIDEFAVVHPDRCIRLTADDPGEGEWDSLRLQQAVSNLIANGLQYGLVGTELVVRVESLPEVVTISVQNEGAPIPASLLASVFEPFKRRSEQNPQGYNLGLGLYIVAEVVRAHGGTVEVESHDATGTRFTLRLPRRLATSVVVGAALRQVSAAGNQNAQQLERADAIAFGNSEHPA